MITVEMHTSANVSEVTRYTETLRSTRIYSISCRDVCKLMFVQRRLHKSDEPSVRNVVTIFNCRRRGTDRQETDLENR
jgi:hypothetical protein